jgi:hypothetical protein
MNENNIQVFFCLDGPSSMACVHLELTDLDILVTCSLWAPRTVIKPSQRYCQTRATQSK